MESSHTESLNFKTEIKDVRYMKDMLCLKLWTFLNIEIAWYQWRLCSGLLDQTSKRRKAIKKLRTDIIKLKTFIRLTWIHQLMFLHIKIYYQTTSSKGYYHPTYHVESLYNFSTIHQRERCPRNQQNKAKQDKTR